MWVYILLFLIPQCFGRDERFRSYIFVPREVSLEFWISNSVTSAHRFRTEVQCAASLNYESEYTAFIYKDDGICEMAFVDNLTLSSPPTVNVKFKAYARVGEKEFYTLQECPLSHPYPFLDGRKCCQENSISCSSYPSVECGLGYKCVQNSSFGNLPQIETGILLIGPGINTVQSYGCNISLPTNLGNLGVGGGATVYKGKPYIYNTNDNKCYYGSLEPSATWDIKENCLSPVRQFSSWTTLGNFIMVTGGTGGSSKLDQIERYDGTTWTTLSNKLTFPRDGHCSVAISNTEMILLGGYTAGILKTVEKYNSDGSIIQTLQSMAIARNGLRCTLYNNELYAAGGGFLSDTIEVYNMETNQWRPINKMKNGRYMHAFFVINNRLTVLGGNGVPRSIEYLGENGDWQNSPDSLKNDFSYGVSVELECPAQKGF